MNNITEPHIVESTCSGQGHPTPHCWHANTLLLSNPPQVSYHCCWCGVKRVAAEMDKEHGPHA
jgi:hypothetical protein